MAASTQLEFAVQMTCQSCADSIHRALSQAEGIQSISIEVDKEQVVVDTTLASKQVQDLIESTGRRAVLQGLGSKSNVSHQGAAVSMVSGETGTQGVIRLVQVDGSTCVFEGTVDGLRPGLHSIAIHELGDISQGCHSCGEVFELSQDQDTENKPYGALGSVEADQSGRLEFRSANQRVKVWDVIGRSVVVHDNVELESNRVACGIIARSAGLFQNPKRICACDGVTIWDERDMPLAGPGRKQTNNIGTSQS